VLDGVAPGLGATGFDLSSGSGSVAGSFAYDLLRARHSGIDVHFYQSGRYISSSVWKMLAFPIHERFPAIVHLAVHLENGQRIYFDPKN